MAGEDTDHSMHAARFPACKRVARHGLATLAGSIHSLLHFTVHWRALPSASPSACTLHPHGANNPHRQGQPCDHSEPHAATQVLRRWVAAAWGRLSATWPAMHAGHLQTCLPLVAPYALQIASSAPAMRRAGKRIHTAALAPAADSPTAAGASSGGDDTPPSRPRLLMVHRKCVDPSEHTDHR